MTTPAAGPRGRRRGGPGTFIGTDYQVVVMSERALRLLDIARSRPLQNPQIRVEPRELVPDGQVGHDFAGSDGRPGDVERIEIKSNPSAADVTEFVQRLPRGGREPRSVGLVAGSPTTSLKALETLIGLAREAENDDHLRRLVREDRSEAVRDLYAAASPDPWTTLSAAKPPELTPERSCGRYIDSLCGLLAVPGKQAALRTAVRDRLVEAAKDREAIDVSAWAAGLISSGLLRPVSVADVTQASDVLLAVASVLIGLPSAIPADALAAALEIPVEELRGAIADQLTLGNIVEQEDGLIASLPVPGGPVTHPRHDEISARLLANLMSRMADVPGSLAHLAPVVHRLAARVRRTHPELVADAFVSAEKTFKRFGDLWTTFGMAKLALEAAQTVAARPGSDTRRLLDNQVRSLICGTSWVMQRVRELQWADDDLTEAARLNEGTTDLANDAFLDKCRGRLKRLLAEEASGVDRSTLLAHSEHLLVSAYTKFQRVVSGGNRRCVEDLGECQSLLARTRWLAGDRVGALRAADEARPILNAVAQSKATADLRLLEAEIAFADLVDADQLAANPDGANALIDQVTDVINTYNSDDHAGLREPNEIIARALLARARMRSLIGESPQAVAVDYADAASLYGAMNYLAAQRDAELNRFMALGSMPRGLTQALDAEHADTATRLYALQASSTLTGDLDGVPPDVWAGIVADATNRARATTPRWGRSLPQTA